jgi:2-dehydro-3-deoxygluconokinase
MGKIVCFGELMMRLNPQGFLRLGQAGCLETSFAGGEANVSVSLANYGADVKYITKLPNNALGIQARNELRRYGVDCTGIVWGGPRLGIYFVEKGASQRPSKVLYDRAGSSVSLARREDFNWESILEDVSWFHFTGITPALGQELPAICLDALQCCQKKGIRVSCDLNYRQALWNRETAGKVMKKLMPYVDLCIANEEDAADIFQIYADRTDVSEGRVDRQAYMDVARRLSECFGFSWVAITLRTSLSADDNKWSGLLYDGISCFLSPEYSMHIVDRVGGGDSFSGALIYALTQGWDGQRTVHFAAAASCLKHSIPYDFNQVTADEVQQLMDGNRSGRVLR